MTLRSSTAVVLVSTLVLSACLDVQRSDSPSVEVDTPEILAAAAHYLASLHGRENDFTEYLVVRRVRVGVANRHGAALEGEPLTGQEQNAIETVLSTLAPVRFGDAPGAWVTDRREIAIPGAAILMIGPPAFLDPSTATVEVHQQCGPGCAVWATVRVEHIDDTWDATGTIGPPAAAKPAVIPTPR